MNRNQLRQALNQELLEDNRLDDADLCALDIKDLLVEYLDDRLHLIAGGDMYLPLFRASYFSPSLVLLIEDSETSAGVPIHDRQLCFISLELYECGESEMSVCQRSSDAFDLLERNRCLTIVFPESIVNLYYHTLSTENEEARRRSELDTERKDRLEYDRLKLKFSGS